MGETGDRPWAQRWGGAFSNYTEKPETLHGPAIPVQGLSRAFSVGIAIS